MPAPDEIQEELSFQVPLSEIYKFNKPEKIKGLAGAHKPDLPKKAAMAPAKRFIISTIGIFCLMVGLTGLFGSNPNIFSILWLILGSAIVWVFLAKPEMDKRKSAAEPKTEENPEVSLIFSRNNIVTRSRHHELKRDWSELIEYKKTKKGIHIYFVDGTETWLPVSAFYDQDEIRELMELLQKKTITQ